MSTSGIGRPKRVPLRQLWKNEEEFSDWLEQSIDALSEELGMSLSPERREKDAGSFQVDLVARDGDGNLVVIENQLEPTDHDHLGKLITYLTNLEAKTAIWITSEPRPEHIKAIGWINELVPPDTAFYLVRLEAYQIGDSEPAPFFDVIMQPSAEARDIGKQKEDLAQRHVLRLKFWAQLLARAKEKGVMVHSARSPSKDHWLSAGAGKSGLSFNYVVWREEKTAVELSIDTGDKSETKHIFDQLCVHRKEIEADFGHELMWERLEEKRGARIRYIMREGGLGDESNWIPMQDAMIGAMEGLSKAMKPRIQVLRE